MSLQRRNIKRVSNNEATPQKRQKLQESYEDGLASSDTNDEHIANEKDTTSDSDCFTDIVNVNKLRNLTHNMDEPEKVLEKLLKPRFGFIERLKRGSYKTELTELLLEVTAVACKSKESDLLTTFLNHINGSKFLRDNVVLYLNRYLTGQEPINIEIFRRITEILRRLVTVFPSRSFDIVTLLVAPIQYLQQSSSAETSFYELNQELQWAAKHRLLGVPTRDTEEEEEFLLANEHNFKCISLAPSCEDIKGKGDPYIRKNKIFSRYTNVNDYLDVQFRLLREDLIRPLREGLAELLESRRERTDKKRKNLMKVYQKVQIVSWRCSPNGIIYKIHFDTSRLKRVKWEADKRLQFGSIVCLSADQFQTMLIGTIADRNDKDLYSGVTFVSFENENTQVNSVQFNCYYEMIESPAYYEPYKNVLGVLQYLDEKSLPFQRYLLNHGHDAVPPPKYLLNRSVIFDFSCAIKRPDKKCRPIDQQDGLPSRKKHAIVLNQSSWPSAEQLGLDDSQYAALKVALTKEFSVIQGPPGTGKTFIGVLIVQLLLANKNRRVDYFMNPFENIQLNIEPLWDGPILIVCCTNHALDQFLEEIIKRHPGKVGNNKIVRIGSRSSSENERLKRCQLYEIKRHLSWKSEIGWTKGRLNDIEAHLTYLAAFVELAQEELLHEDVLMDFMSDGQFEMLTPCKGWKPSVLLYWLYERRGNAWQSDVLREEAEDSHIGGDADCYEDQWGEQFGRQSDFDNTKSLYDFRGCKEKIRKHEFINVSQADTYNFNPWQSLRKIRQRFHEKELFDEANVWNLSLDNRWRLYNYWVSLCIGKKMAEWQTALHDYSQERTQLDKTLNDEHCKILAEAEIVAMTTSAAAKNNKLLKAVKPKIVIVEEAAEVLEAHIVASLSEECQQLILIGDHKQLRPKPADDRLAKHYWLHVSLFERMLLNRMNCECLAIQHRMRPEISKLLVPHIYRSLRDHSNVQEYENIAGVMGNLFFLNHSFEENSVDDIESHSNEHEASFLAAFCKYQLKIGYSPDKITVLTSYTGQLFLLRKYFPKKDFEGIRITPVDNFQGEENDIILLSLVRSNKKNNIGFLSIGNRVCVALSRARKGLYIIGNGDLLRDASPLWRDILDTLKSEGRLVEKLPLGCSKHPENVSYVCCAADFSEVPTYGCKYPCEYRLGCGHACERKCHEMDPGHEKYKCMKPCQRKPKGCRSDHNCLKECHLDCGDCPIPVQRTLARCQHTVMMECHEDENYYRCMEPCKKLCSAGHKCKNPCHYEYCVCTEPVKRRLVKCQHEVFIPCIENERLNARVEQFRKSSDISDEESIMKAEAFYYCHEPCKKSLDCGHPCGKQCYEACNNDTCAVMTEKILPHCQHKAVMACNRSIYCYQCQSRCDETCQAGHQCTRLCWVACGKCEELVIKTLPNCDHKAKVPCYLDPLQYRCELACEKLCVAAHRCVKKCGEQCGNCSVQVEKTLPKCHHTKNMECHENPEDVRCRKPCEKFLSCSHQCQEICGAAKCSQFCTVPVDRTLPCKHIVELPCFEDATSYLCCEAVEVKTCEVGHTKMIDCYRKQEKLGECTTPLKLPCSTKFPNHDFTIPCHALKNTSASIIIGCANTCNVELDCGHRCQQKCEDCAFAGKHPVCRDTCNKQFPLCLHKCQRRCGSPCDPCSELLTANSRCSHVLSDAITMCHQTFELCYERCKWSCPHYVCGEACWKPCDRQPCNRACGKLLHCGHNCAGLCGEPCPGKCRRCNRTEFEEIEKQLGKRFTPKSRFMVLQPCSHLVETNYMDDLVKRFEKHPPCYVDNSLILKCPICEDRVIYCPRYNKVIKRAEWLLNEAKRRLAESNMLKEKTTVSVECWLRSNEYSWSISKELLGNGKGVRLRLGSICILYEIESLLQNFANSLTVQYSKTLDKIGEKMVAGAPSYSKSLISGDILILYRIYIEIQILRLEKLIRGPKLKTILRCKGRMESLPALETAPTDWLAIWKTIKKVSKSLTTDLKRRERMDDVDDYILYLNNLYDVELNASSMSQWMCCSKGHVFPNEESLDKDMIDRRCPLCHPVHDYLLKNVPASSADDKDIARSTKDEKTREHPAEDLTMRVNVLKDNDAKKSKTQPSTVQGTDTSNVATPERKRQECLPTSSESEQEMENMKRKERLGSDSSRIPKIIELVPDALSQTVGKKVVPFVREENVTEGRGGRMSEQHTARKSSREPTRRLHHYYKWNQQTSTAALEIDSQESSGISIRWKRERTDRISEKRSQSRDQIWSERDNSHFKHYNETSTTKRSHRHTEHLPSEQDSDWSPDHKRRRREEYAGVGHSQFQGEMTDWSRQGYNRHQRHPERNERPRPEQTVISRRDYDDQYRHQRTSPAQRGVWRSEPSQRYHKNNVTSSYNGTSYRQVEPSETYSGEDMSCKSSGYEYTANKHYPDHDRRSQRETKRSERNMHTWNGDFTGNDPDLSSQTIKPPDLREMLNSLRINRLPEEPTSTLSERFSDFDETFLTASSSQAYDRPQVSYDEEYFDSLIGD